MLGRGIKRSMCGALEKGQATPSPFLWAAMATIACSLPAVPALAQSETTPWAQVLDQSAASLDVSRTPSLPPACFIQPAPANPEAVSRADEAGAPTILMARCSGTGVLLGEADDYSYFYNPASGAIVVNIERRGRTRVMLMQRDEVGLSVEDITGDLSVAAGRAPTDGLRGVSTDFERFGGEGIISVAEGAADGAGLARSVQASADFIIADHSSRRRAISAGARTISAGDGQ